ncbi:hypothetical protein GUJ93_ZPchr0005g14519 [Zizania palustris]|uniref:Uncharacterized protein n=1 Tax=Zizania palustris TaxID=103762 RepID=A0A8J5S4R3_ZIZPA|nr:hypothetical protein GUJ93_ZPchr0005g14519 [Zizania palustris]
MWSQGATGGQELRRCGRVGGHSRRRATCQGWAGAVNDVIDEAPHHMTGLTEVGMARWADAGDDTMCDG